jgi:hypothetical protein
MIMGDDDESSGVREKGGKSCGIFIIIIYLRALFLYGLREGERFINYGVKKR